MQHNPRHPMHPKDLASSFTNDRQTLKKHERLKGKSCIEAIFEKGISFSVGCIRIVYLESGVEGAKQNKIGVSVSKKLFKRAIDRNRIKRLLRTAYRLNKAILRKKQDRSYQIMLLYTRKTLASFHEVNTNIKKILYSLGDKNT